jgi:hypothetical protein
MGTRHPDIDAHTALFLLKNSFSIPKLTYLLKASPCFEHPDILAEYDKTLTSTVENITNVQLTEITRLQSCLPVKMGGLGLPSASLLATSCFLSSASNCADLVDQITPLQGTPDTEESALQLWTTVAQVPPPTARNSQKKWIQPLFESAKRTIQETSTLLELRRLEAYSGKMAGSWLQALPSSNLGLKLTDVQLRISVALRLC